MSQFGRAVDSRYRSIAALVAVGGAAAVACVSPAAVMAQAAVPEYQAFEVPAPQPQAKTNFGERLRTLDDVDGDGVNDVLMSASNFDGDDGSGGTLDNSGRVYIFSGRTRALLRTFEPPFPQAGAKFGFWDASLGDVDGDGAGDFVTSAPSQVVGGAKVGQVYVYSGRTGTRLRTISPPPLGATGTFGGDFGGNLVAPGDLDGDGTTDFVATASGSFGGAGAAYAFSGKTGAMLYKVANPETQDSAFGFGAAELGDVNADGVGDYQVGAPRYDEGTVADVGRSYIIDGKTGMVLYTLKNPEPKANDRFGQADADGISLNDVDGDGRPDIFVDSFLGDEQTSAGQSIDNSGKAFLFSGASGALISALRDPNPIPGGGFASSNAGAGDIDGDGRPDSIVGRRGSGTLVGSAIVFGGPKLTQVLKTFEDPSGQGGALFGTGLAYPGDVNGDGLPDYFISARGQDVHMDVDVGTAYAFVSQAPTPTVTPTPTPTPTATPTTTPPDYNIPPPEKRVRPGLTAKVKPKRDKRKPYQFTTTGKLKLPSGVAKVTGCTGQVGIKIKRARKGRDKTVGSRRATVRSNCRFTKKRTFGKRRIKQPRGTLKFVIRFQGNNVLKPKRIVEKVKFGRPKGKKK